MGQRRNRRVTYQPFHILHQIFVLLQQFSNRTQSRGYNFLHMVKSQDYAPLSLRRGGRICLAKVKLESALRIWCPKYSWYAFAFILLSKKWTALSCILFQIAGLLLYMGSVIVWSNICLGPRCQRRLCHLGWMTHLASLSFHARVD